MTDVKIALENIAKQQRNTFIINQKRKRRKLLITKMLLDYADNTTLHGLRYVAERGVSTFQKIFWLLMFLASLSFCGYYISNVYVKWRTTPVIVSLDENQVCVGEIPFPSVTICPQIKSRASVYSLYNIFCGGQRKVYTSLENLQNEFDKFEDVATLCRVNQTYTLKYNTTFPLMRNTYSNVTKNIYYEVSPSPNNTIVKCLRHGQTGCFFKRVITHEGVCFNFNSMSAAELFRNSSELAINITENLCPILGWDSETGYSLETHAYPLRGDVNRAEPDLDVILVANDGDRDILCNSEFTGYKIYLHNPLDMPQSSLYYYAALDDQVTSLAVDVNIMKTSQALKHYRYEVRKCYFPQEKYLKFFKIYTAKNCQLECLTNITLNMCDCVELHMPHYNATTRICKRQDKTCVRKAHLEMVNREGHIDWDVPDDQDNKTCRCLPSCNNIEYDAEVLKTNFDFLMLKNENEALCLDRKNHRVAQFENTVLPKKYSKISVYFKKPLVTSMRRSELFGWTDFVANVGGLLGLFLGFSLLSLIEILYFLTVKMFVAFKRDDDEDICVIKKRKKVKLATRSYNYIRQPAQKPL